MPPIAPRAHPQPPPVLLRAEGLAFGRPGAQLFNGLSFDVHPGLSLVRGGDGRGKSSLLRLLAGRLQPEAGRLQCTVERVLHDGVADPAEDAVQASDWLAQRQAAHRGWSPAVAARLIDAFGLAPHRGKALHMLSTGSRRKLSLVAAAASGAPLTLLDAPFAALDAPSCRVLGALLAEAADDAQRAWVIADHERPHGLAAVALRALIDLGD